MWVADWVVVVTAAEAREAAGLVAAGLAPSCMRIGTRCCIGRLMCTG